MITVEIRKSNGEYVGFSSKGHAGYAEEGYDIKGFMKALEILIIATARLMEIEF